MNTKNIFEIEHSYYCEEGNYFSEDGHRTYESISDFLDEWGDADEDYNLLFRWDILQEDQDDLAVGEYWFKCFFMLQRKGCKFSTKTRVTRKDESEILDFLRSRFEHLMKLWEPF